jgi:hypothetical protein
MHLHVRFCSQIFTLCWPILAPENALEWQKRSPGAFSLEFVKFDAIEIRVLKRECHSAIKLLTEQTFFFSQ